MVITVSPIIFALPPGCYVLADQVVTQLFCLSDVCESSNTAIPSRIVHGDKTLPLLNRKWLVVRDVKPAHLTLGVKRVKIDMGDNSQRTRGRVGGQGAEVAISELGPCSPRSSGWRRLPKASRG